MLKSKEIKLGNYGVGFGFKESEKALVLFFLNNQILNHGFDGVEVLSKAIKTVEKYKLEEYHKKSNGFLVASNIHSVRWHYFTKDSLENRAFAQLEEEGKIPERKSMVLITQKHTPETATPSRYAQIYNKCHQALSLACQYF